MTPPEPSASKPGVQLVVPPDPDPTIGPTSAPPIEPVPQVPTPLVPWPTPTPSASPSVEPSVEPSTDPSQSATPPSQSVDCRKVKCIALTFDDGPVAGTTELLDLLKKEEVPATFFVVGQMAQAHPEILARMANEGHVIGNHSYNHADFTKMKASAIRKQITDTNEIIFNATGQKATLMRPPFGASNAGVRSIEKDLGMAQILWNVDPDDWKDRNAKVVADRVLSAVRPGAIILSHDLYATTRAAYKTIIPKLKAQGYVFVTVPQLLNSPSAGVSYSHL